MQPRPLTEAETKESLANTRKSIRLHGLWAKVCIHCGVVCGARLAEYGKPTAEELRSVVCPDCPVSGSVDDYDGNEHIRIEFIEPAKPPTA